MGTSLAFSHRKGVEDRECSFLWLLYIVVLDNRYLYMYSCSSMYTSVK